MRATRKASRISRGDIAPLSTLTPESVDAMIFPGSQRLDSHFGIPFLNWLSKNDLVGKCAKQMKTRSKDVKGPAEIWHVTKYSNCTEYIVDVSRLSDIF